MYSIEHRDLHWVEGIKNHSDYFKIHKDSTKLLAELAGNLSDNLIIQCLVSLMRKWNENDKLKKSYANMFSTKKFLMKSYYNLTFTGINLIAFKLTHQFNLWDITVK